ncbi:MAG: thioredoxin family protein [Candidatus Sumerlaeaceae bacterium]
MKALAIAVVAAVGFSSMAAYAEDIIIEARPEGQNHDKYKEHSGRWLDSNTPAATAKSAAPGLTPQGTCGTRKFAMGGAPVDSKTVVASARFSPKLASAGHYHVYVTFPKAANATPVNYIVKNARGEETKSLAQDGWGGVGNPNSGIWLSLGNFDFAAGDDQYVELQITGEAGVASPQTPGQAFADAVRFNSEPLSDAIPAPSGPAPTPKPLDPNATPVIAAAAPAAMIPAAAVPTPVEPAENIQLSWLEDIKSAQVDAGKSGKKIFVFFYSPESERSNNYDKKVFNNARVKSALKDGYVLVRVNIDENRSLANNLQVFRAGTINIYDDKGNGLNQFTETMDAEELVTKLKSM